VKKSPGRSRKNEFGGGKDCRIQSRRGPAVRVVHSNRWHRSRMAVWFYEAVETSIERLRANPTIGRLRAFQHVRMQGLRSLQLNRPFERFLIFYKSGNDTLTLRRLISGERDLPRRLPER
jgi:hypothetical protein